MEDTNARPPNNSGQILRLEIRQKNASIKKRKVKTWSPEQDDQLAKLYDEYPKKWGIIASMMQERNQNQCLHRYRRLSQLGAHKKIWSAQEDQTIISLIKKVGKNWKLLAEMIGTKTGKQIRQRFINKLDPKIKTEEWTDQQDKLILKYYSQVGSKWSEISKKLPGRPENKIKNRFYSYIQKNYDIRYIYVDQNSTENKQQKIQLLNQITPDDFLPLCLPLQASYQPREQVQNKQRNYLQEISINAQNNSKNLKSRRKKRIGPAPFSRFATLKNQQNIFQDQPQPVSISKSSQKSPHSKIFPSKIISQSPKQKNSFQISQSPSSTACPSMKARKISHFQKIQQPNQLPSIKQLQDQFKIALGQPNFAHSNGNSLQNAKENQNYNLNGNRNRNQNQNAQENQNDNEDGNENMEKDQIFDSNVQLGLNNLGLGFGISLGQQGQKFYIKSLIKVDDQLPHSQHRYRSIRDLVSNGQIEPHENQLFYLSHH